MKPSYFYFQHVDDVCFMIQKSYCKNMTSYTLKEETFAVSRFLVKSAKVYSGEIFQKMSSAKVSSREIF